jgi:hypothetical protein
MKTGDVGRSVENADWCWKSIEGESRWLAPLAGVTAAVVSGIDYTTIDANFVENHALGQAKIVERTPGELAGKMLVFKTGDGRLGKARIVGYRTSHDFSFAAAAKIPQPIKDALLGQPEQKFYHLELQWEFLAPVESGETPPAPHKFDFVPPHPARFHAIEKSHIHSPMVDLRPIIEKKGLTIRDQGSRDMCSVFAMTFLYEYLGAPRAAAPEAGTRRLSPEYLNYVANVVYRVHQDGHFFSEIAKGYKEWGIVPEQEVPLKPKYDPAFNVAPRIMAEGKAARKFPCFFLRPNSDTPGATPKQIIDVLQYLDRDIPVAAGLVWPPAESFTTETIAGIDVMVPPKVRTSGHSVVLVGYRKDRVFPGGGYFVLRNSWGAAWGDHGYCYITFDYVEKNDYDLVMVLPAAPLRPRPSREP